LSRQPIELVPLEFIKPLPMHFSVIGHEENLMLRADMTRIESKGLYNIDPILLRIMTPQEIEECKAQYPLVHYEIVDGHQRFEAAGELGWRQIRAIVISCSREEAYAINYKKNRARGKIDPMREAVYFRHLNEDLQLTQDKIAEMIGIDQSSVSRILKRIKVSKEARREIMRHAYPIVRNQITGTHLEVIASIPEPEKQVQLVDSIMEGKLSAKQAEQAKKAIEKGLPKEEVIKAAKAPTPPVGEIEIGEVKCSECGLQLKIIHIDDGKHKLKKAG